jgi:hypothetical protein
MSKNCESRLDLPKKWPCLTLLAPCAAGESIDVASHTPLNYVGLSPARKCLVDVLREIQFGRIEGLSIIGGEPQFIPHPTIIQTIRLPLEDCNLPSPPVDYALKRHFNDLFHCFDRWRDRLISRLECRFGVPCLVETTIGEGSDALSKRGWSSK